MFQNPAHLEGHVGPGRRIQVALDVGLSLLARVSRCPGGRRCPGTSEASQSPSRFAVRNQGTSDVAARNPIGASSERALRGSVGAILGRI